MAKAKNKQGQRKKAGRPLTYSARFHPLLVKALAIAGRTDEEIAEYLGVATSTLYMWYKKYPALVEAKKAGMQEPDDKIEFSLFEKAMGLSVVTEEKIITDDKDKIIQKIKTKKNVPPSDTAQIFWLKNRRPEKWRDKQEIEHSGGVVFSAPKELDD